MPSDRLNFDRELILEAHSRTIQAILDAHATTMTWLTGINIFENSQDDE